MIKLKNILLLTAFLCNVQISVAQLTDGNEFIKKYTFVKEKANVISQAESLSGVMEKLYDLKTRKDRKINILHIGDSHLQADFITSIIRNNFQQEFGNGGRGMVIPYKVAKTNGPADYIFSSTSLWQSKRCALPNLPLPIGIGGITINTPDSNANFTIRTNRTTTSNDDFNKVTLFYQKDSTSYHFALLDSLGKRVGYIANDSIQKHPFTTSVYLSNSLNYLTFQAVKSNTRQNNAMIYGVYLENCNPGIIYNTIGVNGAKYQHYSKAIYFSEQSRMLHPDLIILSMGTNEAYAIDFSQEDFYADILLLFKKLKSENPTASFLLTTPACSYRKKIPNPRLALAAKTIIRFAKENNLSYWDLQGATGGDNSAYNWRKNHLLRPDGVHYQREGYELQGTLFYNAFLNSYRSYVANRH